MQRKCVVLMPCRSRDPREFLFLLIWDTERLFGLFADIDCPLRQRIKSDDEKCLCSYASREEWHESIAIARNFLDLHPYWNNGEGEPEISEALEILSIVESWLKSRHTRVSEGIVLEELMSCNNHKYD